METIIVEIDEDNRRFLLHGLVCFQQIAEKEVDACVCSSCPSRDRGTCTIIIQIGNLVQGP